VSIEQVSRATVGSDPGPGKKKPDRPGAVLQVDRAMHSGANECQWSVDERKHHQATGLTGD
jgi:hypothetical protein